MDMHEMNPLLRGQVFIDNFSVTSEQVFMRPCRSTDKFPSPSRQRTRLHLASNTRSSKLEVEFDLFDTVVDARASKN